MEDITKIVERIPERVRWEIAARAFTGIASVYNKILLDILGKEKFYEMLEAIWSENGRNFIPAIKEAFRMPAENAVDAMNMVVAASILSMGPEFEMRVIERSAKRAVARTFKCPWLERYREMGVAGSIDCVYGDLAFCREGLKAINPKFSVRITKAMPRGDPYCEHVVELLE